MYKLYLVATATLPALWSDGSRQNSVNIFSGNARMRAIEKVQWNQGMLHFYMRCQIFQVMAALAALFFAFTSIHVSFRVIATAIGAQLILTNSLKVNAFSSPSRGG